MNEKLSIDVFSTSPVTVARATYKDSIYFIMNGKDITEYVRMIHGEVNGVDIHSLQNVVNVYLESNPDAKLVYPKYDFVLMDDPTTSAEFVLKYCVEILGIGGREVQNVITALNSPKSNNEYFVGTYTGEIAKTLAMYLESGNQTFDQGLKYRLDRQDSEDPNQWNNLLHTLVKRDYPDDL